MKCVGHRDHKYQQCLYQKLVDHPRIMKGTSLNVSEMKKVRRGKIMIAVTHNLFLMIDIDTYGRDRTALGK